MGEVGAQPPLGFWDPLGLLENADQERFDRLREVELKHGRISMLAVLGHVVTTAGVRLPGNIDLDGDKFSDIPTGLAALGAVPPFGLVQVFFFAGFLELFVMKDITRDAEFVGDFRNGYIDFGWDNFTPEEKLPSAVLSSTTAARRSLAFLGLWCTRALTTTPTSSMTFSALPWSSTLVFKRWLERFSPPIGLAVVCFRFRSAPRDRRRGVQSAPGCFCCGQGTGLVLWFKVMSFKTIYDVGSR